MSDDESEWNEEIEHIPTRIKTEFQCKVCFNIFFERIKFIKHIEIHKEQFALDFIKKYQPVSGNMIFKKFKNLNLLELEKKGLVKFSDEFMGWCLPDFSIKNKEIKNLKIDSILNCPCFTCKYEKSCDISNELINPLNCKVIEDWVKDEFVIEEDSYQKSENHMETLAQAEYFCKQTKKFDIVGKFEISKIQNSANKFIFIDNANYKIPIILKLEDEMKIILGENIIIKNVKLTKQGKAIDAKVKDVKIHMV
jgi:hypothetical protein